jgi:hypothetical protein
MSKRCPLKLSNFHHGALIKVLSNKSRTQRSINSAFLTKAEVVINHTGLKSGDLDYYLDEEDENVFRQTITISKNAHKGLYSLYTNASTELKSNLLANVLCRCAEYIENNPDDFNVLLSKAFLSDPEKEGYEEPASLSVDPEKESASLSVDPETSDSKSEDIISVHPSGDRDLLMNSIDDTEQEIL